MRLRHAAVLVLSFAACARTAHAGAPLPRFEEHRLANGLRVLLSPDDALDDVTVAVAYETGRADDPSGLEGLAHVTEHMLFRGSRHVAPGEHARALEAAGASVINAETANDTTTYHETIPPSALPLALWLESDRMGFAAERIDDRELARERKVVEQERLDRVIDSPLGRYGMRLHEELYPAWHPYNLDDDTGLEDDSVERIEARDVRAFIGTWYSTSNATIAIAGRFDPRAALALVTKYFGSLPAWPAPARPALPPWSVDMRLDLAVPLTRNATEMAWPTPPLDAPGDRELDVVALLLTGRGGRLRRALVDAGLARSVGAVEASHARGSEMLVSTMLADGVVPDDVIPEIDRAISAIASGAFSAEELARAKRTLREGRRMALETSRGRAMRLVHARSADDPWQVDAYERCDAASVAAAARDWLPLGRRAVVVLHGARNAPPWGMVLWSRRGS